MKFERYTVNLDHRGKLPLSQKSRWTLSEWEELRLFALADEKGWTCLKNSVLWSVKGDNSKLCTIGIDADGDLYIAKYTVNQSEWHGYPVAPRQFDIPPANVLKMWVHEGLVTKAKASKILQGQM